MAGACMISTCPAVEAPEAWFRQARLPRARLCQIHAVEEVFAGVRYSVPQLSLFLTVPPEGRDVLLCRTCADRAHTLVRVPEVDELVERRAVRGGAALECGGCGGILPPDGGA